MSCTLQICTLSRTYPVYIRHAARAESLQCVAAEVGTARAFVITDETVGELHAAAWTRDLIELGVDARLLIMAPGEANKTLTTVGRLAAECIEGGADRGSVIIAFGGGIVGDVAGFVAATLLRGVRWIQVPTTLLAQVDSSVGGKTGVNHSGGKNLVGAFHQPQLVFADTAWFATLPPREVRAGMAEAIKHAAIADVTLFAQISAANRAFEASRSADVTALIAGAIRVKAEVVAEDEREHGRRAILNFGHTLGHALEATWPGRWRHGEAVALGMAFDVERCHFRALISGEERAIMQRTLAECGLPSDWRALITPDVLDKVARDKKIRGEYVNDVLLDGLGHARIERIALTAWQQMARSLAARG
ncbi:MAG: 3-dehydroquinate synthase [Bradymonadia bacterium]|jgi:3-dehydroquinate synthase